MGTNRPRVQCWIIRVHIIMTAANCSPAVASRRAKYDDDFRIPTLLGAQPFDILPRAPRQRATHNIDMAIEPEKGGKLAHERLQSALPVRTKTRSQPITPDGTPGLLCWSIPGRCQTAIVPLLLGCMCVLQKLLRRPECAPRETNMRACDLWHIQHSAARKLKMSIYRFELEFEL